MKKPQLRYLQIRIRKEFVKKIEPLETTLEMVEKKSKQESST